MNNQRRTLSIFLSFSGKQRDLAEQIYYALTNLDHDVFFDKESIRGSQDFNRIIMDRVRLSDLTVYLISPDSVADGSYARTELKWIEEIWPSSSGRIMPVMVEKTSMDKIPNYLKSVHIIEPQGNVVAETVGDVEKIAHGWKSGPTFSDLMQTQHDNALNNEENRFQQELAEERSRWERQRQDLLIRTPKGDTWVPDVWDWKPITAALIFIAFLISFAASGMALLMIPGLIFVLFYFAYINSKATKYNQAEGEHLDNLREIHKSHVKRKKQIKEVKY